MKPYVLHYAPDNASMIIRLALEELRVPYQVALVDRRVHAQSSATYKRVNPVGRIPALETANGAMFETAAIGLWLADNHRDPQILAPEMSAPDRGPFLSWLFFLSNTVHAEMRSLFYPSSIVGPDLAAQTRLSSQTHTNLTNHLGMLDKEGTNGRHFGGGNLTFCDLYICALLRWLSLYPVAADRSWFNIVFWPSLHKLAQTVETRDSVLKVAQAEGLGATPFSNPSLPNPPEGSAL